jgi:predicted nucleotidyltransferase
MILQYGSCLFGSETKESDFDIIVVVTLATLRKYLSSKVLGLANVWQPEELRRVFFFGEFMEQLKK